MATDIIKDNVSYRDLYSEFIDFSVKRTERLTSALYLVSELIPTSEPLRTSLREKGIGMLSDIFALTISVKENKDDILIKITSEISELISLIKIASVSGLISEMNSSILEKEYAHLCIFFESRRKNQNNNQNYRLGKEIIFNRDFFENEVYPRIVGAQKSKGHKGHNKRHQIDKGHDGVLYETNKTNEKLQVEDFTKNSVHIGEKSELTKRNINNDSIVQEERQRTIVQLVKDSGGNMNIKDISLYVKGCSEKTLQRDLIFLMQKGIIKKTGERRWSRYFLAK